MESTFQTQFNQAVALLNEGKVVGMPTETVYGLAARIDRPVGIDSIFTTKQRPDFDPLIVHVASIEQAKKCVKNWTPLAQKLAQAFWPGPLTMVLPKASMISSKITSGLESVGLRCPNHEVALELIKTTGPVAAPSANRFGKTSPTTREHVLSEFSNTVFTLEGGTCQVGIESTVVGVFDDHLEVYRPGMITPSMLKNASDVPVIVKESPVSPGALKHHYMPDVPMYLLEESETLPKKLKHLNLATIKLSLESSIAARELYQSMREACRPGVDAIILIKLKDQVGEGWDALWNRVDKAITEL